MKIEPVPKGLDGRDDAGRKRAPGQDFEVSGQGMEGAATEFAHQPASTHEPDEDLDGIRPHPLRGRSLSATLARYLRFFSRQGGSLSFFCRMRRGSQGRIG